MKGGQEIGEDGQIELPRRLSRPPNPARLAMPCAAACACSVLCCGLLLFGHLHGYGQPLIVRAATLRITPSAMPTLTTPLTLNLILIFTCSTSCSTFTCIPTQFVVAAVAAAVAVAVAAAAAAAAASTAVARESKWNAADDVAVDGSRSESSQPSR